MFLPEKINAALSPYIWQMVAPKKNAIVHPKTHNRIVLIWRF
jgi:hypothetical protein